MYRKNHASNSPLQYKLVLRRHLYLLPRLVCVVQNYAILSTLQAKPRTYKYLSSSQVKITIYSTKPCILFHFMVQLSTFLILN